MNSHACWEEDLESEVFACKCKDLSLDSQASVNPVLRIGGERQSLWLVGEGRHQPASIGKW